MNQGHIAVQKCKSCGHTWIEVVEEREACLMCGGKQFDRPVMVYEIRKAYEALNPASPGYKERRRLLEKLYWENAPAILKHAQEVCAKVLAFYEDGDFSDRVLNRLAFCYIAFRDLGLDASALSAANLLGIAFAQRGEEREVLSESDLEDYGRALQWFALARQPAWIGAINLRLGMSASRAVTEDTESFRRLLQIARRHLQSARGYYSRTNQTNVVESIEGELATVVQLLPGAAVGSGFVEGAHVQANALEKATIGVQESILRGASYIGLSVQAAGREVGASIAKHGEMLAQAVNEHGERVEAGLGRVAGQVGFGLGNLTAAVWEGLGFVGSTIVSLGDKTEQGLDKLSQEVKSGFSEVSKEMDSMGTKVAFGMLGGGALAGLLAGGAVQSLGGSISDALAGATRALSGARSLPSPANAGSESLIIGQGLDAAMSALGGEQEES